MKNLHNIILIGPLATGKSALATELSILTGMRNIPIDKIKWYYRFRNGYDLVKSTNLLRCNGFDALIEYAQNYFGPREINAILQEFSGVIDFGASDTQFNDLRKLKELHFYLDKYPNIFLILPSEDEQKSKEVLDSRLRKRYKNDPLKGPVIDSYLKKNEEFIRSYQNYSFAKHVIYTDNRRVDEIAQEIIYKCDFQQSSRLERVS